MRRSAASGRKERMLHISTSDRINIEHKDLGQWDELFEDFLLDECDYTLEMVFEYLDALDEPNPLIYNDVLAVAQEYQSDRLLAILCRTIPKLDADTFEELLGLVFKALDWKSEVSVTAFWAARLIFALLEKAEDVPRKAIALLQNQVYTTIWPADFQVALVLLRVERQMNELLLEDQRFFANRVPDTEGEIGDLIQIEKAWIMKDWPTDEMRFSLPYRIREYLGDLSGIEDELLEIMAAETGAEESGGGLIVLGSVPHEINCNTQEQLCGI